MDEQLPIASIEAEEAILGQVLFQPKLIIELEKILPAKAFYVPAHQSIYQAMIDTHHNNQPPDFIHLSTYLQSKDILDSVGGTAKLLQLQNRTISTTNYDRYAKLVLEKYRRRRLILMSNEIISLANDQTLSFEDMQETVRELISNEITPASQVKKSIKIRSVQYGLYSQDKSKKLEAVAEVTEGCSLLEASAELAAEVEQTTKKLWEEKLV